ncbi:MAG: glycosyltransferase [Sediminibacterium sp.]|nr:glycosyltransferase [Sediminibacterium sp.]
MRLIIITICFNNLPDLLKTVESVDSQTRLPDEHWIMNGSTQPDIANWFLEHPVPAFRTIVNESDKGISDAFNKGIQRAGAGMIQLLNAGDTLLHATVLAAVDAFLQNHSGVGWISGKIVLKRGGAWVEIGKAFESGKLYRGMRSVAHPSWWVHKQTYLTAGPYQSQYKIAMDYDMMCRLAHEPYAFLPLAMVRFDDSGISTHQYLRSLEENQQVYESYAGYSLQCRLWQLRLRLLHYALQTYPGRVLFGLKRKLGGENW